MFCFNSLLTADEDLGRDGGELGGVEKVSPVSVCVSVCEYVCVCCVSVCVCVCVCV